MCCTAMLGWMIQLSELQAFMKKDIVQGGEDVINLIIRALEKRRGSMVWEIACRIVTRAAICLRRSFVMPVIAG